MKKILLFACLLSLILMTSCKKKYKSPLYVKLSNKIVFRTAEELKKEKNLYTIGSGGALMYDVEELHLAFNYMQTTKEIAEARELVLYAANKLIYNVNQDEDIQPYLHDHPFGPKNSQIIIHFNNNERLTELYPYLSYVIQSEDKIKYYTQKNEKLSSTELIHEDSFEEAQKLVKENKTAKKSSSLLF